MNSTNYWDKPRRGAQSKAVEDTLWSQRGTVSPRKAEAPRRRGNQGLVGLEDGTGHPLSQTPQNGVWRIHEVLYERLRQPGEGG